MSNEYNNTAVGSSSCAYAKLARYNNGSQGMSPPVPATTVSGVYVVPAYGAPGYNTLNHGAKPSCSGYFNIQTAYGANASTCGTKYVQKLCQ